MKHHRYPFPSDTPVGIVVSRGTCDVIASDQAVGLLMVWVTVSRTRETSSSQACGANSATYSTQAPTDIFKTGTLYGPDKLAVPGKVEGRNCQITIDTGSNISIVRPDVLPEKKQSEIQPINQCIRTFTGEKAPIRGKGNLCLRIGSTEIVYTLHGLLTSKTNVFWA